LKGHGAGLWHVTPESDRVMEGPDFSNMAELPVHPEAASTCTYCGCLCHDVRFDLENPDFHDCRRAEVAASWIQLEAKGRPKLILTDKDIDTTTDWLTDAVRFNRTIAFTGLEYASCEVQKAAIALAETVGAWVLRESEINGSRSPWAAELAQKGCIQASWSEIRQRSDSLLLWYAFLSDSHPRWIERFGPRSERAHRLAVVARHPGYDRLSEDDVDRLRKAGWTPEQFIELDPAKACEFLRAVREALGKESIEPADSDVRKVVHLIRNARWLAIVRRSDPTKFADPLGTAEAFADLVAAANQEGRRRVVTTSMSSKINEAGLDAILSMKTGLTTPLRFTPAGPVQDLGEWSEQDVDLLVRFHDCLDRWGWYGEKCYPSMFPKTLLRFHEAVFRRERTVEANEQKPEKGIKGKWIELASKLGFAPKGEASRTKREFPRVRVRKIAGRRIGVALLEWGVYASGTIIRADGVPVPVRGFMDGSVPDLPGFLNAVRKEVRRRIAESASSDEPELRVGEPAPGAVR